MANTSYEDYIGYIRFLSIKSGNFQHITDSKGLSENHILGSSILLYLWTYAKRGILSVILEVCVE